MDYDELFPGRFLKSGEFKGRDVTLTIKKVRTEELPQDNGGVKVKGIISFGQTPKELVLNRTNGECIKAMFGRNVDEWIGKRVTFWPAPFTDSFSGEEGTAIRIRGSPDISADLQTEIRLPRRRPIPMRLIVTGKKNAIRPSGADATAELDAKPSPPDDDTQDGAEIQPGQWNEQQAVNWILAECVPDGLGYDEAKNLATTYVGSLLSRKWAKLKPDERVAYVRGWKENGCPAFKNQLAAQE